MPSLFLRILVLFVAGCACALGAAPATLGYQGRLADAGGTPISASLNITFRLYDVASGGSALWAETQAGVAVDGGNLAVELGKVAPLPSTIWGRQLYLGVQVAGDSEMLPRPPLTAAPYALRAAGTMKNTVVVSAEGTPTENGAALLAAVAAISGASAPTPVGVELDAGTYDLGTARLEVPSYVELVGRGQLATTITTANPIAAVRLAANTSARALTARNTGLPPDANSNAYGIGAETAAQDNTPVDNVTIQDVTGIASTASGSPGGHWGIWMCVTNSRVLHATAIAQGGQFSVGFRADCPTSSGLIIDGLTASSANSSDGVRGAYLAGGGPWNDIKAFATANATISSAFGVRVFANTVNVGALLSNVLVHIDGGAPSSTAGANIDGIRIEGADVDIKGAVIDLDNVQVTNATGLRINAPGASPVHTVEVSGATVNVSGIQRASQGFGGLFGFRAIDAAAVVSHSRIAVHCLAGGYNLCVAARRQNDGAGLQAATLVLDQVSLAAGHDDPADTSAQTIGYWAEGAARIVNSTLRITRTTDGEINEGVRLATADADVRVLASTVEVEDAASPNNGCVVAGGAGSAKLFGDYFQGHACVAGATLSCAGNTKPDAGFLASACP